MTEMCRNIVLAIKEARKLKIEVETSDGSLLTLNPPYDKKLLHDIALIYQDYERKHIEKSHVRR